MFLLIGLLLPNVALNKEATQSSSYHHIEGKDGTRIGFVDPDEAHYAVDGNFGTDRNTFRRQVCDTPRKMLMPGGRLT